MAADSTTQLQGLIDRLSAGDPAARDELIGRAYGRLRRLAHKMLAGFPPVRSFEDTDDVLHDSLPRLTQALAAVPPASVADFFGLASRQMHWELLDLVQRYYGPKGPGGKHAPPAQGDGSQTTPSEGVPASADDPPALAAWTEFHEAVEALPEKDRRVFELLWYQEMTQAEAAVLGVAESTVRRHWLLARRRLGPSCAAQTRAERVGVQGGHVHVDR
jgi:RNA polymerase sigma-70 factor (ECF subfamily)